MTVEEHMNPPVRRARLVRGTTDISGERRFIIVKGVVPPGSFRSRLEDPVRHYAFWGFYRAQVLPTVRV